MSNILRKICEGKKIEIQELKKRCSLKSLQKLISNKITKREFKNKLINSCMDRKNFIIGEIKKASPSGGQFFIDYNPVKIAKIYEKAGASAISILTESKYFMGEIDHLSLCKQNTH